MKKYGPLSSDLETTKWLSSLVGDKTAVVKNSSWQSQHFFYKTESQTLMAKPLLSSQVILQFPANQALLFIEGNPPIISKKLRWDKEPGLTSRVREG